MKMQLDRIDEKSFDDALILLRRDLHKYPECGWTEYRTTVKVIEALEALGMAPVFGPQIHTPAHRYGMPPPDMLTACEQRAIEETGRPDLIERMKGGFTGCVAEILGSRPGPTVAFRFDLDCNDAEEADDPQHRPAREGFRSTHPNLVHACGHDGHTAIGIGAAQILTQYRDQLAGRVIFVFQPAEEGLRGANSLTQAGIFRDVDYLFGGHIGLKLGRLGVIAASGHGFLASTKFDVNFQGKEAHAGV
ncbi:MAG: amidohydrolase, partial [Oscillospiraceae bacterium]